MRGVPTFAMYIRPKVTVRATHLPTPPLGQDMTQGRF